MKKSQGLVIFLLFGTLFMVFLTPTLAYQDADPFTTSKKEAVVSYIFDRVQSSGGFSETSSTPTLASTYRGIKALSMLGVLGEFSKTTTVDWIDSFRNSTNGAYCNFVVSNDSNDFSMQATSHAIGALVLLGETSSIQANVVDYIDSLQNSDGGFGNKAGNQSTLSATYLALRALFDYNQTNNLDNVTNWLWSRQNNNSLETNYGAFASNLSQIQYSIVSSWEAVDALYYVLQDSVSVNNTNALKNWVKSCQNLMYNTVDKGGFNNNLDEIKSQVIYSAAAASIVKNLNLVTEIDESWLLSWVLSCQNTDGGFGTSPAATTSSLSATYYAILTLDALGRTYLLNEIVYWQEYPNISVVFIIFLVVLFSCVGVIIVKYKFF